MAKVIPVFIASPGDVQVEREYCRHAVEQLSPRLFRLFGTALSIVDWHEFAPDAGCKANEAFQLRILNAIEPDSLFVGILYERIGSPIAHNSLITGTEAEYDYAIRNRTRIRIMTYFRRLERIDQDQLEVGRLRKKIIDADLPRQDYSTVEEFANRILLDLLEAILRGILGDPGSRRRLLSEFFRFGSRRMESHISPPLIVYPPIHKHDRLSGAVAHDWRVRLLPNVVYEDFKTIQKIEAALRTIGVYDYRSVTTLYPQASAEAGNRIWLCLPRNPPARDELAKLKRRACFTFEETAEPLSGGRVIRWKDKVVRSPLAAYLALQRPRNRRPWEPKYGQIVAQDFAVIARFRIDTGAALQDKPFYHYYIAGIRGLGTWGAGWYLDRNPDALAKYSENSHSGDMQILLEVTFKDHCIVEVKNVSNKTQDYFNERNDMSVIKAAVAAFSKR